MCSTTQKSNDITVDVASITQPVRVGYVTLGAGRNYFTSNDATVEVFREFFTKQIEYVLSEVRDSTGITLDVVDLMDSIVNGNDIVGGDRENSRWAQWSTEIPNGEIWARITTIFAERSVLVKIYVLQPGKDLIFGVHTEPTTKVWLEASARGQPR